MGCAVEKTPGRVAAAILPIQPCDHDIDARVGVQRRDGAGVVDMQLDVGVRLPEVGQPGHHPARRHRWQAGNGQSLAAHRVGNAGHCRVHAGKTILQPRRQTFAIGRWLNLSALALKQLHVQRVLKVSQQVADRRLCDVQFVRCRADRAQAHDGLKGPQDVVRRHAHVV